MTASLGRWTQKIELQDPPAFFARFCRFVHRPSEAVFLRPSGSIASGGFTLVEILVTFALIAIILPVAMNGISMAARLASQSKHRVEAGILAEQKLNNFVATGDWDNGDQEGTSSDDNTEYTWKLEVLDWTETNSMQRLKLTVTWKDAGTQEKSVSLSTLVYTGSSE